MVLKLGYFGKQIRNTWKVYKCGAREGRKEKISWTDRVKMRKYYTEPKRRRMSYVQ
jgi:hypothetical protein